MKKYRVFVTRHQRMIIEAESDKEALWDAEMGYGEFERDTAIVEHYEPLDCETCQKHQALQSEAGTPK